jgi:hypothetical protein
MVHPLLTIRVKQTEVRIASPNTAELAAQG